ASRSRLPSAATALSSAWSISRRRSAAYCAASLPVIVRVHRVRFGLRDRFVRAHLQLAVGTARQDFDLLLGFVQPLVELAHQAHTALERLERLLERQLARLELRDEVFERPDP